MAKDLFEELIPYEEESVIRNENPDDPHEDDSNSRPDDEGSGGGSETPDVDERAVALFSFLQEEGLAAVEGEFAGTVDALEQVLQEVPIRLTQMFLESIGDSAKSLVQYALNAGPNATVEDLKNFFSSYVEPLATEVVDETSAYAYLQQKLSNSKTFPTEARLIAYLDSLVENEEILSTAKTLQEEEKTQLQAQAAAKIQAAEQDKVAQANQSKELYQKTVQAIDGFEWSKDRKEIVKKALEPAFVQKINTAIANSPVAIAQLADLYTYFDEATGSFDLSRFEQKALTKKALTEKKELEKTRASSVLSKMTVKGGDTTAGSFWEDFKTVTN